MSRILPGYLEPKLSAPWVPAHVLLRDEPEEEEDEQDDDNEPDDDDGEGGYSACAHEGTGDATAAMCRRHETLRTGLAVSSANLRVM